MIKKLLIIVLSVFLALGGSGCKKAGPIPDGYYFGFDEVYEFTTTDIRDSYGWEIDGDTAKRWVSGSVDYKAKIVKKGDGLYFDGYRWRTVLDVLFRKGKRQGRDTDYLVSYDEGKRTITITPIDA